jgi:hypothetical protein
VVSQITFVMENDIPHTDRILLRHIDPKLDSGFSIKVKNEAIMCSGTFGSPPLLMRR